VLDWVIGAALSEDLYSSVGRLRLGSWGAGHFSIAIVELWAICRK